MKAERRDSIMLQFKWSLHLKIIKFLFALIQKQCGIMIFLLKEKKKGWSHSPSKTFCMFHLMANVRKGKKIELSTCDLTRYQAWWSLPGSQSHIPITRRLREQRSLVPALCVCDRRVRLLTAAPALAAGWWTALLGSFKAAKHKASGSLNFAENKIDRWEWAKGISRDWDLEELSL